MLTSEAPSIVKISNGVKTPIITSSSLFANSGFKCRFFLEKGFGLIFGVLRGKCKLFLFLFMRKFHVALIFCELVINILFCFMYVRSKCDNADNISEWCNKNI